METMKAYLPDIISARIDDLVNAQSTDEEMTAHMRELNTRLENLLALARDNESDAAAALTAEVRQLADRIRWDFVTMAYRQGLIDGGRLRELFLEQPIAAGVDKEA